MVSLRIREAGASLHCSAPGETGLLADPRLRDVCGSNRGNSRALCCLCTNATEHFFDKQETKATWEDEIWGTGEVCSAGSTRDGSHCH